MPTHIHYHILNQLELQVRHIGGRPLLPDSVNLELLHRSLSKLRDARSEFLITATCLEGIPASAACGWVIAGSTKQLVRKCKAQRKFMKDGDVWGLSMLCTIKQPEMPTRANFS